MRLFYFTLLALLPFIKGYTQKLEIPAQIMPYDSTVNRLQTGELEQYIGQVFFMPETNKGYNGAKGFYDFVINLKGKVYKPGKGEYKDRTQYDAVTGKYFDVLDVIREKNKKGNTDIFIQLREQESGDILFYWYQYRNTFPFLVEGYIEKTYNQYVGKEFFIDNIKEPEKCLDYFIDATRYFSDTRSQYPHYTEYVVFEKSGKQILNSYFLNTHKRYLEAHEKEQEMARRVEEINRIEGELLTFAEKRALERSEHLVGQTVYNIYTYAYEYDSIKGLSKESVKIEQFVPYKIVQIKPLGNPHYENYVTIIFEDQKGNLYSRNIVIYEKEPHTIDIEKYFSFEDVKKKYPRISKQKWTRINNGEIWLGMTRDECRLSRGAPNSVNRTTSTYGTYEQWVYDNRYLYFENGVLKTIQD